jgi:GTP-binding protein
MPPTFAIFTSGQIEPSYQRFIERRLREDFGFVGSPVHVQIRARQKNKKR